MSDNTLCTNILYRYTNELYDFEKILNVFEKIFTIVRSFAHCFGVGVGSYTEQLKKNESKLISIKLWLIFKQVAIIHYVFLN
jgi:hypothetical protein